MTSPWLTTKNATMRFGDFTALDNVSVAFEPGVVHAVVGQNGAGKTTFARIVCGLYEPTNGSVYLDEQKLVGGDVVSARAQGVDMVHQHFSSPPSMTIAECLQMFSNQPKALYGRKALEKEWQQTADSLGLGISVRKRVRDLTVPQRQSLEITRALSGNARVLIFDEPTASIPASEIPVLFERIRSLARNGMTVVVVLHKLAEVFAVADTITVLEKGRVAMPQTSITELTPEKVAGFIVGQDEPAAVTDASTGSQQNYSNPDAKNRPRALEISGLSTKGATQDVDVEDINLNIHQGDIVGVAGVEGNGQRSLVEAIVGLSRTSQGSIVLNGRAISGLSVLGRRRNGIRAIPFERNLEGVSSTTPLWANIAISEVLLKRSGLIRRGQLRQHAIALLEKWKVSYRSTDQNAGELSGGNIQRAILSRELTAEARLIVAAQPTRGLDIGAITFVQKSLVEVAARGGAVLLVSSDLDEIKALATRIVVVRAGRIVAELDPSASLIEIGTEMVGTAHA